MYKRGVKKSQPFYTYFMDAPNNRRIQFLSGQIELCALFTSCQKSISIRKGGFTHSRFHAPLSGQFCTINEQRCGAQDKKTTAAAAAAAFNEYFKRRAVVEKEEECPTDGKSVMDVRPRPAGRRLKCYHRSVRVATHFPHRAVFIAGASCNHRRRDASY